MKNQKHTPGPWNCHRVSYNKDAAETGTLISTSDGAYIAEIDYSRFEAGQYSWQQIEENALILAAAPESHEGNIAALEYLRDPNPRADRRYEVITLLEAIIAKAQGNP